MARVKKPPARLASAEPPEEPVFVPGTMQLHQLFPDKEEQKAIVTEGKVTRGKRDLHVRTRRIGDSDKYEILALGAVSRDPGRSDTWLEDNVQDFQLNTRDQARKVQQYWNIYKNEGVPNNAVTKVASLLSASGSFKIRYAKKGKKKQAQEELTEILHKWAQLVNANPLDGVVTGAQGLKAINHQAVRYALVEGSWIGRTVWGQMQIGDLGSFEVPTQIQSISTANIEVLRESIGTGMEVYYWKPPQELLQLIRNPPKELKQLVKKFVPSDVTKFLLKDNKAPLDPALMIHVKNRGVDGDPFGESFLHAAIPAIAYNQAVTRLDLTSMQNLINRLTIVMVGADEGAYAKPEVSEARTSLMNTFFEDPGPNMTIVWAGNDVEVVDVGAHSAVLDLDDRFKVAESRIKVALGIPDALLTGTATDGKAAGWAATIGAAAQLEELANQFQNAWTTIGNRIAIENGYTNVDLTYEFDRSLIVDRVEEQNQLRNNFIAGGVSYQRWLKAQNVDPEAEYERMVFEKGLSEGALWVDAFKPPEGLQGQGEGKVPGNGRTPDSGTGKTSPERPTEKPTTEENR